MSDHSQNIVLYTSPIAALRFKNVGQGDNINGQNYIIAEKDIVKIIDKNLIELEHIDNNFAFLLMDKWLNILICGQKFLMI